MTGRELNPGPAGALPEGSVLLHIGPVKTGTTAIQTAMADAREAMRQHGVVYPGPGHRTLHAGWWAMGHSPWGKSRPTKRQWLELCEQVSDPTLRACISTENFGSAGPEQIDRIVTGLGRERLHVVMRLRPFDRMIPSTWQQSTVVRGTTDYETYLQAVLVGPDAAQQSARPFWKHQDLSRVLRDWSAALDPSRVHVVISDPSDPRQLHDLFEHWLGLPDGLLELTDEANPSLSYGSAELARLVNRRMRGEWDRAVWRTIMRDGFLTGLRNGPRAADDADVPAPPAWAAQRIRELEESRRDALLASGVNVLGDVDDLVGPRTTSDSRQIPSVDQISLELAAAGVESAMRSVAAMRARLIEAERGRADNRVEQIRKQSEQRGSNPPSRDDLRRQLGAAPLRELVREVARRGLRRRGGGA